MANMIILSLSQVLTRLSLKANMIAPLSRQSKSLSALWAFTEKRNGLRLRNWRSEIGQFVDIMDGREVELGMHLTLRRLDLKTSKRRLCTSLVAYFFSNFALKLAKWCSAFNRWFSSSFSAASLKASGTTWRIRMSSVALATMTKRRRRRAKRKE